MLRRGPTSFGERETDKLGLNSLWEKPVPNWDTDISCFTLKGAKAARSYPTCHTISKTKAWASEKQFNPEFLASVIPNTNTCHHVVTVRLFRSFIHDRHTRLITARRLHNVSLVRSFCKQIHHAGDWFSKSVFLALLWGSILCNSFSLFSASVELSGSQICTAVTL